MINASVNACMSRSDQLFKQLKQLLDDLKLADEDYKNEYNKQPHEWDFIFNKVDENGNKVFDKKFYYEQFISWETRLSNKENYCKKLVDEIENCLNVLSQIDSSSIDKDSIGSISSINISNRDTRFDEYDFTPYKKYLLGELLDKIDFSFFGYDEKEVLEYFNSIKSVDAWNKLGSYVYYTPSNFNEFLHSSDMKAYTYDELIELRGLDLMANDSGESKSPYKFEKIDDVDYYSHMVKIGDSNFEFTVLLGPDQKNDILKTIYPFIIEVSHINELSHYTQSQLNIVEKPLLDYSIFNSYKPWTTISYQTGLSCGGYYSAGKNDVVVNTETDFDFSLNTLNHEFGHKIDNIFGHNLGCDWMTEKEKWRNLIDEYYDPLRSIMGRYLPIEEGYNEDQYYLERFAEMSKYYQRYPDEFKIVAPELYEEYNNIVNPQNEDRYSMEHPIVTNGKTIQSDSDSDRALYMGGYRTDLGDMTLDAFANNSNL